MSTTRRTNKTAEAVKDHAEKTSFAANDGVARLTDGMSKLGSLGQENVEAMTASASVMAKSLEKIGHENMEFAKAEMETVSERAQAMTKVKSPQEFFEAQADYMKSAMERQIEQTNKVSDLWISAARDAAQPLSKRYSAMVEMMQAR